MFQPARFRFPLRLPAEVSRSRRLITNVLKKPKFSAASPLRIGLASSATAQPSAATSFIDRYCPTSSRSVLTRLCGKSQMSCNSNGTRRERISIGFLAGDTTPAQITKPAVADCDRNLDKARVFNSTAKLSCIVPRFWQSLHRCFQKIRRTSKIIRRANTVNFIGDVDRGRVHRLVRR